MYVYGNKRPNLGKEFIDSLDKYTNESDFLKVVGIAAGRCAEMINEEHGDNLNPEEFCVEAIKQARALYNDPVITDRDYDAELG
jgi:hypothetical protein